MLALRLVPFAFACAATDAPERFVRSWGSSLGNVGGSLGCLDTSTRTCE